MTDAQAVIARAMSERQLQDHVVALARALGWRVFHPYDSRRSEPGFPDMILVRDRLLAVELKRETGRLTRAQEAWLAAFRATEVVEVYVWRPADWLDGTIEAVLR